MAEKIEIRVRSVKHGSRQMLFLKDQYKASHPEEGSEIYPDRIAKWAIELGLWSRPPMEPEEVLRRMIRRALREDYTFDPQGREIRSLHPVMEEVSTPEGKRLRSVWWPIYEMPPQKARESFQLRRRAALRDVVQLRFDFDSYNDNNLFGAVLDAPDFNFNKDLQEMSHPTDYPESPETPVEDEEDDI